MTKPKSINFSFLVLVILFILTQTAFALSATLSYEKPNENVKENNIETSKNTPDEFDEYIKEKARAHRLAAEAEAKRAAIAPAAEDASVPATLAAAVSEPPSEPSENTQPQSAPTSTPTPKPKGVVKHVNANTLNVREKPDKNSKLITSIKRGDKVTYYETTGEWARIITWTDKPGYVLAKYLVNNASDVQQVAPEKTVSRGNQGDSTKPAEPISAEGASLADKIVAYAKTLLGIKYVYGGYSTNGFDCSGFTKYVFAKYGINLPRSSSSYYSIGAKVDRTDLRPGDIVLWDINGGTPNVGHVGIYIGDGMFIHASSSIGKVVTKDVATYNEKYMGARRVIK